MAMPPEVGNGSGQYTYQEPSAGVPAIFAQAQKLHQAERYADAEGLYRRILQVDPNHLGAWHLLGLSCAAQEKLPDAGTSFQRVLDLMPDHVDALTQMGIVLAKQNRLPDAIARFRRAIELKPDNAKAQNNLGVALTQTGRHDDGIKCYMEAARLQPDYAEAHFNLGVSLADRKQHGEAIAAYERAIQARPDYADAMFNLGMLYVEARRPGDAVMILEQAARFKPANSEAHNNLALALADLGRFADAVESADEALRFNPLNVKAIMNRGNALGALGRIEEAIAAYDLALKFQPDYASARWNRSLAWLVQGDYERGWMEYEWRWQRKETKTRNFPEPRWDGSPLEGKTILLWCEQGIGDSLQFVRYAAALKKQGATVWLECPAKLTELLSRTPGIDRFIAEGTPLPSEFDCQAPLMSLPMLCGTTLANVPAEFPYVNPDPARVDFWKKELGGSKNFKIGIGWQGNPQHRFDQHRSFSLTWFAKLAALKGIELYSLQKGPGAEQLKKVRFPVVDLASRLDDASGAFTQTAAAMHALDLVIACDSALIHLAGAMGMPVWLPLSTPADWRWMLHIDDTPWYPTMRIFRQPELGQWGAVFDSMATAIERIRGRRHTSGLQLEVAPGELLDKFTILQIKTERIRDEDKLRNVRAELAVVEATRQRHVSSVPSLQAQLEQLKEVNERLWDIENDIRDCEKSEDFGPEFIRLARAVYKTNDLRAAIKKQINELMGASFREEKEYHGS